MPRGGRRPGAGRPLGAPNKVKATHTVRMAAKAQAAAGAAAEARGEPTALNVFELKLKYWLREFQAEMAKGEGASKSAMAAALDKAEEAAANLAPYRHPRLRAVLLSEDEAMLRRALDLGKLTDADLAALDRLAAKTGPAGLDPSGDPSTRH